MTLLGTLLNRLFGTNFDVMDETKRQQTTKGERLLLPTCFCAVEMCIFAQNAFGYPQELLRSSLFMAILPPCFLVSCMLGRGCSL